MSKKRFLNEVKDVISEVTSGTKQINDFQEAIGNMETSAIEVAKQFGQGRENILNIKAALNDAADSLRSVGLGVEESLETARKIQMEFSGAIGRNALLASESFGEIEAMTKVAGTSVTTITNSFADAGMSILQAGEEMSKVISSSREIGVNTKQVSDMVLSNLSKTSQFNFQGGVEGMAKMAAQAVNLRIDMKSTLDIADKLFDPEKAIDMAAAMQRLGVAQSDLLDPLRLMDLAQNDPAELQNQIAEMSKEFVRLNEKGQFEIMPGAKRQLKEIETQLGLGRGELSKMALAGAELEDKLSKIKLPEDTFNEDQRKFIANMATMGPGGEYTLKVDGKDMGLDKALNLFTQDKNKLNEFMEAQKPKTMEELAKEQINIFERMDRNLESLSKIGFRTGMAVGSTKTTEDVVTGFESITSEVPDIFESGKLSSKSLRESSQEGLGDVTSKLKEGDVQGAITSIFTNTSGFFKETLDGLIKNGKESVNDILNSKNDAVESIVGLTEKVSGYKLRSNESETSKTTKEASVKPMTVNEELKTTKPETTTKESTTTTNEVKFTQPLKLDISVSGVSGLSEQELKSIIEKSNLDELLYDAVKRAEATKVGTTKP
jgi:hypothetical protein